MGNGNFSMKMVIENKLGLLSRQEGGIWKSYHTNGSIHAKEWDNDTLTRIISCYDEKVTKWM
jgi:antitoxin component YwqK of YwqJK toxin-antitoxin module